MSNNSGVQQHIQQQQQHCRQPNSSSVLCKECGLSLNSAESLEVHQQNHSDNILTNWTIKAMSSHSEETNNNTSKANMKRELIPSNTIVAADNSDSVQKKSPEYNTATPESIFGHPPTPQSYQSASSPYQNHDNSTFSPNFPNYQQKNDQTSPNPQQQQQQQPQYHQSSYPNYSEAQYFPMESNQNQQYLDSYPHSKNNPIQNAAYRYHPYSDPQQNNYQRQQTQAQVVTSSPAYPPQPTPSPSPKQCDKCGYVCESASQLIEHLNVAHPPTPAPHLSSYQPNQHFMFDHPPVIKQEDNGQSEILDLDSHKVVHNVFPEEEKHQNGDPIIHNTHSVPALLNSWGSTQPPSQQQQQKMFQQQEQRIFMNSTESKLFSQNIPDNIPESKLFSPDQKLFQPQIHNQDFMVNGVTTTTQESSPNNINPHGSPHPAYRPFEHLASPPNAPVISSTQVPNVPTQPPPPMQKSSNWKSNEARRPKTYNCTACNKWFTSSGHLKRHYNTTLHKNAVKSSGQPDPASLPISAHHHPARDSSSKQDDRPQSGSSGDEVRSEDNSSMPSQFERMGAMPGLLQQPPSSPYDRQPAPNIHHTPPLHSPMQHSPMSQHPSPLGSHLVNPGLPNLSNSSPPNGEAGLSTTNLDSRGLLSLSSPPINTANTHGFNMMPQHMMSMDNNQFQMYPNESAPPRYANYGYQQPQYYWHVSESKTLIYDEDDYKLTILTSAEAAPMQNNYLIQYSPNNNNNNNLPDDQLGMMSLNAENESKFHINEDSKVHIMKEIKLELDAEVQPSEKSHIKPDYEESTGSPQISSTVLTKPRIYKCYDCHKTFNKACYLTQHNKTFHSGDKPYKCTRCGKRFSCETTYEGHLSKHAGDKPHKCELCPKQFNHKTDLRRHMCLHTGHKPYACDTCGKGFIRKDHMMKHHETHLRKTQSKLASIC
ncbi:hypothetical protein NQ315_013939 [Exocentrus adspersus]|uniref:C2H2-type domain-containing protein n=1 Tax=Exocentrus adspersus TaxID=1586481 RepID=A0AAV8VRP1_9CUCU|nr:hypothetical protein NQ315_013939 [Exocentrus adspersus]